MINQDQDIEIQGTHKQNYFEFYQPTASVDKSRNDYQYEYQSDQRARAREIAIDLSKIDWERRKSFEWDYEGFCRYYFSHIFYNDFTDYHREMGGSIVERIKYGGRKAIAAPRGEGKSSLTKIVGAIWAVLYGHVKFIVLIGANGDFSQKMLLDIKLHFETNDSLHDDFPEICDPIRSLEGVAQRGKGQMVNGERTLIEWGVKEVVLPAVRIHGRRSPASGAMIVTVGMDGSIRGQVRHEKRPDLVIVDDPQTRDTARSPVEIKKALEILDMDIDALAGQGKSIAVVVLCTVIKIGDVAHQITDRKLNPSWHGLRLKLLLNRPQEEELWEKYIDLRQTDQINDDDTARNAHQFYLDHRSAMDAGSVISNPNRHNTLILPDGSLLEVSTLQFCYNKIADIGWNSFNSEYQNEPPDDSGQEGDVLDVNLVCRKVNGIERRVVPAGSVMVTRFIDIGGRYLHWSDVAWKKGLIGSVIDYGVEPVYSPVEGSLTDELNQESLEKAIYQALMNLKESEQDNGWTDEETGEVRHVDLCLVDSGYKKQVVYDFCATTQNRYRPAIGFGSNAPRYRTPQKRMSVVYKGSNWHATRTEVRGVRLYQLDANHFKQKAQNGIITKIGIPGSISLFGDEPVKHRRFAEHICAEAWRREFKEGKGWTEGYKVISRQNHWLDTLAGNVAAATIHGLSVLPSETVRPSMQANQPVKSFAEQQQERMLAS